jgi:hypothetical protein
MGERPDARSTVGICDQGAGDAHRVQRVDLPENLLGHVEIAENIGLRMQAVDDEAIVVKARV